MYGLILLIICTMTNKESCMFVYYSSFVLIKYFSTSTDKQTIMHVCILFMICTNKIF